MMFDMRKGDRVGAIITYLYNGNWKYKEMVAANNGDETINYLDLLNIGIEEIKKTDCGVTEKDVGMMTILEDFDGDLHDLEKINETGNNKYKYCAIIVNGELVDEYIKKEVV